MSDFDKIIHKIEEGLEGKNEWIPFPFKSLAEEVGIARAFYFLFGAESSVGKSSLVNQIFIIDAFNWWRRNKGKTNISLEVHARVIERPEIYTLGRWLTNLLWLKYGILIDVKKLYSIGEANRGYVDEELMTKIKDIGDYFEEMMQYIHVYPGDVDIHGLKSNIINIAKNNGEIHYKEVGSKKIITGYTPNDESKIIVYVVDHIGIVDKGGMTEKEALDHISRSLRLARDIFGFTVVPVSQFNRSMGNIGRRTKTILRPEKGDFEGSSKMYHDADVVIGAFNPREYEINEYLGYDVDLLGKRFRTIHILKNSYGEADIDLAVNYVGEIGHFRELPPANKLTDDLYHQYAEAHRKIILSPI